MSAEHKEGKPLPTDERCKGCKRDGWVEVTPYRGAVDPWDWWYACGACGLTWWGKDPYK